MKTLEYTVRFNTPAFLGNAEQSGQWRTPPFKALLRQWWRVAVAEQLNYDYKKIRVVEGKLFGHAWLEGDLQQDGKPVASRKSEIRMRLNNWEPGKLKNWESLARVNHPEVGRPVGSDLYLGYGPLMYSSGSTGLKANAAIQANESARLLLAVPAPHVEEVEHAVSLINQFGTIGGRSRNGWGSVNLLMTETDRNSRKPPARDWQQCMMLNWPHAVGKDGQGALVWETSSFDDWKSLMKELASIKIGLRTQFHFSTGKTNPAVKPESRHWLSYPVTNHDVKTWGKDFRLPNNLRFKVVEDEKLPGKVIGRIFHIPHTPPDEFRPNAQALRDVWLRVHSYLDQLKNLRRSGV